MSNDGVLTIEDFMIHFANVLNQSFGELRGILLVQAVKLQKLENMLKELQSKQAVKTEAAAEEEEVTTEASEEHEVPEKQLGEGLKQVVKQFPVTSTPKPKRRSTDADMDEHDDSAISPYGEKQFWSVFIAQFLSEPSIPRNLLLWLQEAFRPRFRRVHSSHQRNHMQAVSGNLSELLSLLEPSSLLSFIQCHCGKLFKKKSSLTTHKTTHSTDTFTCHCGSIFKCEQYLKNHQRRKHIDEEAAPFTLPATKRPCLSFSATNDQSTIKKEALPTPDDRDSFDPMELLNEQISVTEA